jgi:hypothetical protein
MSARNRRKNSQGSRKYADADSAARKLVSENIYESKSQGAKSDLRPFGYHNSPEVIVGWSIVI